MTAPMNDPDRDDALDERSRAALRGDESMPPPGVRTSILGNARVLADERRVSPPRAANDARWQIPAAAAIVAAIALLITRPNVDQPVPPPPPSASPPAQQAIAQPPVEPVEAVRIDERLAREKSVPHSVVLGRPAANRSPNSGMADANTGSTRVRAGLVEPATAPAAPAPMSQAAGAVAAFAGPARVARAERTVDASRDLAVPSRAAAAVARTRGPAANINEVDSQGRTALMRATQINSAALVRSLLAQGADPNVVDAEGTTPLGVARRQRMTEIERILEASGGR